MSRITVSTPEIWRSFKLHGEDRPYQDRVKPANFVLSAQVAALGHPVGVDPPHFHPLAPFSTDPRGWLELPWVDKYSGRPLRLGIGSPQPPDVTQVVTYGEVIRRFVVHPEPKSADIDGNPCGRTTVGYLRRRHIRVGPLTYIGKESNRLDDVEHGLIHDLAEVRAHYSDPATDPWVTDVLPVLHRIPAERLARTVRCTARTVKSLRNRHTKPSRRLRPRFIRAARDWARRVVARQSTDPARRRDARRLLKSPILQELEQGRGRRKPRKVGRRKAR